MTSDAVGAAGGVEIDAPTGAAPEAVATIVQLRDVLAEKGVSMRALELQESGDVRLEYVPLAPMGTDDADDEISFIVGAYSSLATDMGVLEALTARATTRAGVAEWRVESDWIEAWDADEIGSDGLLERVAETFDLARDM